MSAEHHEQNGQVFSAASERESKERNDVSAEDKTLLKSAEHENEPTRRVAAPDDNKAQTALDTEPTKILSDNPDETDSPKRKRYGWRFVLGSAVFVLIIIYAGINARQVFLLDWTLPFDVSPAEDRLIIYVIEQPSFRDKVKEGDELVSFNGQPVTSIHQFNHLWLQVKAGDRYTIATKRDGQVSEFEFIAEPIPLNTFLHFFITVVLIPAVFLLTGLLVFLFKPNDKQAFLLAMMFALFLMPGLLGMMEGLPSWLVVVRLIGFIITSIAPAIWLHFFLVFPERSPLLRRFPALEYLIYLPCLLFILPGRLLNVAMIVEYDVPINFSVKMFFLIASQICGMLYFVACVPAFWLSYRQASEVSRRKLRVILFGLLIGLLLPVISILASISLWLLNFHSYFQFAGRLVVISEVFLLLIPPVFAYAIVRHQVIPVSFIVRRGLQYLLAKNALRLLLILPVVGIIWNIAANPNRTVSEILFQNSFTFYFFIVLAVIDGVLMRSRLNEWIDKKFFREQYNQERLLHELIDDVKESDSMSKLSRLVSRRIQSALHPMSVYLFYRDDAQNSDFSLGFTTSAGGSTNLSLLDRLAADSPLLRFMQTKRGTVEFPLNEKNGLPQRERDWLSSIGANLLVPMHGTDGKLAGFFSLGEKMSQIPYTSRDKELLETLANQIALVQENLSLKDRVRREQKIKTEVLSRFDEGNINLLKECPFCGKCFDRTTERCDVDNSELTFSLPVERTIENRYRLEKLIGKGGMGAVYEATDTRINRTVAVKILSGAMFGNRDALRRFEREAQTAGRLQHPNIVTVFDYGVLSTEGAFLVMELFRGESLKEILDREEKLDSETVVAWFGQILDGVEAAHKQGIIHRDLKPDNILVVRSGAGEARLCILDFGLARLNEHEIGGSVTVPGTIMGTFGYMPPEQLRGERTDERSDLFATGVMIYEALHGKKPYAGKTYQEIMRSMSKEITFGKDEPFAAFFKRSLALKPEKRFVSASAMKQALTNE